MGSAPRIYGSPPPPAEVWVQELDRVAADVERVWGVDRLPLLVSPEQRERWSRQQDKLHDAIQSGDRERTRQACEATIRGYAALVREAESRGHQPLQVVAWEAPLRDGFVLAVVQTLPEQHAHQRQCLQEGRNNVQVWTVEEIGRVLHMCSPAYVHEVKQTWPGAEVRPKRRRLQQDDIPF